MAFIESMSQLMSVNQLSLHRSNDNGLRRNSSQAKLMTHIMNKQLKEPFEKILETNLQNYDALKEKVEDNKMFLDMLVNDLRSPTIHVKMGLNLTLTTIEAI